MVKRDDRMTKNFKILKPIIIILSVLIATGVASGVLFSRYRESPPVYRPMIFCDGTLFWDEKIVDADIGIFEYIGKVNSRVSVSEKPDSEFECNCEGFMNAEIYRDSGGDYYAYCTNGNLLLLDY